MSQLLTAKSADSRQTGDIIGTPEDKTIYSQITEDAIGGLI